MIVITDNRRAVPALQVVCGQLCRGWRFRPMHFQALPAEAMFRALAIVFPL
jgi:hypothetical protein